MTKFQSKTIFPNGNVFIDQTNNGWVNLAIVVAKEIQVIDSSLKGDGSMRWIIISTPSRPVNIASIYAPSLKESRVAFWRWL